MGRKHTTDTKEKISKSMKGRQNSLGHKQTDGHKMKVSKALRGKPCVNLGYKHTDKTKRRISELEKGEKHYNWQGGISFDPYCVKFNYRFKEMIRDKFNRVCFLCGKSEEENDVKLSVHHVSYNKECLCSEIECEFVPLCMSCHSKTNNNRIYWENKILEMLI